MRKKPIIMLTAALLTLSACETVNNYGSRNAAMQQRLQLDSESELRAARQRALEAEFRNNAITQLRAGDNAMADELLSHLGKGVPKSFNSSFDIRNIRYDYNQLYAIVQVTYNWMRTANRPVNMRGTLFYKDGKVAFVLDEETGTRNKDKAYINTLREGIYL